MPDEIESKEDSSINKSFSEDSVDENKDENSTEMICKQHMANSEEKRLHNSFILDLKNGKLSVWLEVGAVNVCFIHFLKVCFILLFLLG